MAQVVGEADLRRLHYRTIESPEIVRSILGRLCSERIVLRRGMNDKIEPETALIKDIGNSSLTLATVGFEERWRDQVFLNCVLDGEPYFLSATPVSQEPREGVLVVEIPRVIYRAERRDRPRVPCARAVVVRDGTTEFFGEVEDESPGGLGIRVPGAPGFHTLSALSVGFLDGETGGGEAPAIVRYAGPSAQRPGWLRLGLDMRAGSAERPVRVENRQAIFPQKMIGRAQSELALAMQSVRALTARGKTRLPEGGVKLLRIPSENDEQICAIVDAWGATAGATAVVIPPAWGRTKETLLPLAATIVATFKRAGLPIVVVRFDGIRKRGESHNDPDCRLAGNEHHRFAFSQGVRDILAVASFLRHSSELQPARTVLVTFSAAALEGRKAVAVDGGRLLNGWVSVVGTADLQSMMRVISGGVDYVAGVDRGLQFGLQEILGVTVDIDRAGIDALKEGLAYLEDAQNDFLRVKVPVTWFHGRYDAWMDGERVRTALSTGDTTERRFVTIPTGHQLRTSREALEVFQAIAVEVGRMVGATQLKPTLPNLADVEAKRIAERARRPKERVDLRQFWSDYLLGRDREFGIELMTATRAYRDLMTRQLESLGIVSGGRFADLGSGTGAFAAAVLGLAGHAEIVVDQFDYVREALNRSRSRLAMSDGTRVGLRFVECDLAAPASLAAIPVKSNTYDGVIASLVLSYVADPLALLREVRRILKPGGRLVISSLRRDADISRIFREGFEELRSGVAQAQLGISDQSLDRSARKFLNEAARLLEHEETGLFRFYDAKELAGLAESAGFEDVKGCVSFGSPGQAVIVAATKGVDPRGARRR